MSYRPTAAAPLDYTFLCATAFSAGFERTPTCVLLVQCPDTSNHSAISIGRKSYLQAPCLCASVFSYATRPFAHRTSAGNCRYPGLQAPPRRRALEVRPPLLLFAWATGPSKAQGPWAMSPPKNCSPGLQGPPRARALGLVSGYEPFVVLGTWASRATGPILCPQR